MLCLPTKANWWDDSRYTQVDSIIRKLAEEYRELGIRSLAIPPVGCGLGRLDYVLALRPLLYKYYDPLDIPVKIVFGNSHASKPEFD